MTYPADDHDHGVGDDGGEDSAAYWQQIADELYADEAGGRVCQMVLAGMSTAALAWSLVHEQWAYAVVFAVFVVGARIGAWITSSTISLDRYGQPLTGADADRLAQLHARTYWAARAHRPHTPGDDADGFDDDELS